MANRYSVATGNASSPSTWDGGATVPGTGDRVLICTGHTVTLDGTFEWGDDSTSTITINSISTTASIFVEGTLKASRSTNSQLTCNGHLYINARSGVYGTYDAGTAADPIPSGVTHTVILNKSASLANGKYGLEVYSGGTNLQGKFTAHGVYRKRNPVLVNAVSAGATSALLSDCTGWAVGDQIVFAPTTAHNTEDVRTVATITPGSGTQATITFSALTYAHAAGAPVGNFFGNVIFKPYSTAGSGWSYLALRAAFSATSGNVGFLHLQNARIEGGGSTSSTLLKYGMLNLAHANANATDQVNDVFSGLAFISPWSAGASGVSVISASASRQRCAFLNVAIYSTLTSTSAINEQYGCVLDFVDTVIYRSAERGIYSFYSQGGCNCTHNDIKVFGCTLAAVEMIPSFGARLSNSKFGPCGSAGGVFWGQNASSVLFDACDFGYTFGAGASAYFTYAQGLAFTSDITAINCMFSSGLTTRPQNFHLCLPSFVINVQNKNADITLQETHIPPGSLYRDNSIYNRSRSSARLEPAQFGSYTPYAATFDISFYAENNVQKTIVGYLRKNSSYGASTPPSVTISGLGITPVSYTMSGSADQWEKFTLNATQTSGAAGNLTLTFSGQSANSGAKCWLDGIAFTPFVLDYRHYGYMLDSGNVSRTADPLVQLSESAALALSGLAIDYGTQTLTITGSRSLREIYDYCKALVCQTANLAQPDFFTSTDGVNFACAFNIALSGGAITGTGAIAMASNTLTVSGGGTSTAQITHNAGVLTPVTITVKDASTGAAVQNARVRILTDVGSNLVLEGLTDASGVLTGTTEYADNAVTGTVRRATDAYGTRYKPGSISGATTSAGFSATVLLISDE